MICETYDLTSLMLVDVLGVSGVGFFNIVLFGKPFFAKLCEEEVFLADRSF